MTRKRLTKKQTEIASKIQYLEQEIIGFEMQIKRLEGKIEAYREMFLEDFKNSDDDNDAIPSDKEA